MSRLFGRKIHWFSKLSPGQVVDELLSQVPAPKAEVC